MDKNTIIGLVLIFGIFIGFSIYNNNKTQKLKEQKEQELAEQLLKQAQDSATINMTVSDTTAAGATTTQTATTNEQKSQSADNQQVTKPQNRATDYFATPNNSTNSDVFVETNVAKYAFAKLGGYVKYVELKNIYRYTPQDSAKQPLILFQNDDNAMNIELMMKNQALVNSEKIFFSATSDTLIVNGDGKQQLSMRAYPNKSQLVDNEVVNSIDSNSYIEYLYTFSADDYRFNFDIHFVNMTPYLYGNRSHTLSWRANVNNVEKNYEYERDITTLYYMDNVDEVDNLDERSADKKDFSTELKWVSFKQQFFTSVLIADSATFKNGVLKIDLPEKEEKQLLKQMFADLEFEVDNVDNGRFGMSLYFGPNQYKLLNQYDLNLERQVPLGWGFFLLHWINRVAVIPIFNWLEAYGMSYGIIILILTIILKLVLFPVAYKTYLSSAKMRVLKPEIEELSKRFPDKEDAMKKQQATMTLYKKAGINPMAGCLPMLLQMPILIAFFRFFPSAYELRQQPFLWAEDLSTYDSILDLSFNIPFYGDHVSLFTLLMTIATIVYTWLNNRLMSTGGDQQRMMKIMMYIMPILFLGMFNSFSSALTYYYLLVNLITFFQMWIFRMAVNEKKIREKLQANMAKPIKKSKWQLRMEELAKQQQQMQKMKK